MRSIGRVVSTRTLLILATLCVPAPATAQAWAPKGDLIAYWFLEPEDIWVVSPTGDGLRVLVDDPERDFGPAWDPTGDRLLFTSVRDGYHAIYSVDLSTGVERKLSPPDSENSDASLSPDGRWMVYTSDRSGDPEIWLEPLDGSTAPRQLTHRRGMDAAATFSPDGRQILYASWATGDGDLRLIDADGRHDRALTDTPDIGEFHPAWSPDGQTVTFIAGREGELELTVMGADGDLRRVVRRVPGRQHFFPRFSPDGEWIAFFSDSADETKPIHGQPALMRIRVDGTDEQTIVTRERTLSRTEPSSSRRR